MSGFNGGEFLHAGASCVTWDERREPTSARVAGIDGHLLRAVVDLHKLTGLLRCWDDDRLLS